MQLITSLFLALSMLFGGNDAAKAPVAKKPGSATYPKADDAKLTWLTIEQAQELNKKKPRKIFVDVYTDWCGWCKRMDKTTFSHPEVVKYLNANYYAVKMNAEQTENIIFKNQVYKFNAGQNSHDLAVSLLNGQMSFPTTVYLDEKLNVLSPVPGYLTAPEFLKLLNFYGQNKHKKQSFEEFSKVYKSDI